MSCKQCEEKVGITYLDEIPPGAERVKAMRVATLHILEHVERTLRNSEDGHDELWRLFAALAVLFADAADPYNDERGIALFPHTTHQIGSHMVSKMVLRAVLRALHEKVPLCALAETVIQEVRAYTEHAFEGMEEAAEKALKEQREAEAGANVPYAGRA